MFKCISIKSKKSMKKAQDKTSSKGKTSLESTRGSELSESFSEGFDNLRVDESRSTNTLISSNYSDSI